MLNIFNISSLVEYLLQILYADTHFDVYKLQRYCYCLDRKNSNGITMSAPWYSVHFTGYTGRCSYRADCLHELLAQNAYLASAIYSCSSCPSQYRLLLGGISKDSSWHERYKVSSGYVHLHFSYFIQIDFSVCDVERHLKGYAFA